ncbi:MAG: hypothetical protein R6V03_09335 [Kiritimatiellia bacterium]
MKTVFVVIWIAMAAWLIRFEAFPGYFTRTLAGYEDIVARHVLISDQWMKVLYNGTPAGYSHTGMEFNENDPSRQHRIHSEFTALLPFSGNTVRIEAHGAVFLDALRDLQAFDFEVSFKGRSIRARGSRVADETFDVAVNALGSSNRATLTIPDNTIVYSPLSRMAIRNLKPGEHVKLRTLDPLSLETVTMTVRGLRAETIVVSGNSMRATVLSCEYGGLSSLVWVGPDGRVIRQETPYGFTLEAATPEEAMNAFETATASPSLPHAGGPGQ